jgi:hypothetical protein
MADEVAFETTLWVSNSGSESGGDQPFFDSERYTKEPAAGVPSADEEDQRLVGV